MLRSKDDGLTLVELLIALLIFTVLSLVTTRTLSTASATLAKTSEQALRAQESMRWVRLVRYDIQGSVDLYVHGSGYPTNPSLMCSSARTLGSPSAAWAAVGATTYPTPAVTRGLFTVVVKDVNYDRTNAGGADSFLPSRFVWVGYEIRRAAANGSNVPYQLWRVVCNDTDGGTSPSTSVATPVFQERILDLGTTLDITASGRNVITCPVRNGNGLTFCPEGASTATIPWYSLSLPLSKVRGVQTSRDATTLLNAVTRMVGK